MRTRHDKRGHDAAGGHESERLSAAPPCLEEAAAGDLFADALVTATDRTARRRARVDRVRVALSAAEAALAGPVAQWPRLHASEYKQYGWDKDQRQLLFSYKIPKKLQKAILLASNN